MSERAKRIQYDGESAQALVVWRAGKPKHPPKEEGESAPKPESNVAVRVVA